MQTANVNGVDLHYADHGPKHGPAVVFANSLGTDFRLWDALLPHLPDGLRLVRYDKRGHGLSGETPGPYSIDQLADDAAGLIRHLDLSDVVFIGLSIGGLIGQSLAVHHGDLLRALVISNSAAKIGDSAMWQDRIAAIRQDGLSSIGPATMERWFSPGFRASGAAAPWQRMLERQPVGGYIACCEAIAAADLREAAPRLDLPTQLIAGDLDGATPPDVVKSTADLIAGARLDVIPGVGHLPCVEAPAAYADILTRFLKEVGHV
ncbi:3-oxoadipate enol-lactonase [Paracoccus methylarcula]|uniref:3-oxoadipate enol-lactonase n=1 Tax=Paracoccus methylarcula TaxID=72022 RepID=A0A3R7M9A6_9RHOB|nr:3-oxoadipate enol-lactonase [Paracoccus methylarcula]RNF34647.1 3-oxoadipate enol-lactonase [Paracoccus methylarcula]